MKRRTNPNGRGVAAGLVLSLAFALMTGAAPARLSVEPASVEFSSLRDGQRLLVSADFSELGTADLTRESVYESLDPTVAEVSAAGLVLPRGAGETRVIVRGRGTSATVRVSVSRFARAGPVRFGTEVVPALSRAGCSQGACHGSPQGKNGFRLSLRGFDPALDYDTLAREAFGRRVNPTAPAESLVLLKGTGEVAHQGGPRFRRDEAAYRAVRDWVSEGCPQDSPAPACTRLEVLPGDRRLHESSRRQQLIARAHFEDGTVRDVTGLAVFTTSDESALRVVDPSGLVEFSGTGEAVVLVRYLEKIVGVRLTYVHRDPGYRFSGPPEANAIDRAVFAKQRDLQLNPAPKADDATFLRRVYLDVTGALPTPEGARAFLDSADPGKRAALIDALLEGDEYVEFWALKWADVMRGNRSSITKRGAHSFHRYLLRAVAEDRPFAAFAREVLTSQGNALDVPAANFFRIARTPEEAAEAAAQLFLGVRIQCAKCHNHPFEAITQGDYYGLAAYFARVKTKGRQFGLDAEVVFLDRQGEVRHPTTKQVLGPSAFGAPAGALALDEDPRQRLADWLARPDNKSFAPSIVNRAWYHLMGRGVVEPVDDFRDTNPPSNPALLQALTDEFQRHGGRLKPVLRLILNSNTYQLDSKEGPAPSSRAAKPDRHFTRAAVKMLTAEQVLDAISAATGVPERFEGYPAGTRAVALAEGGGTNHFLTAFTKPARDVSCECARDEDPSLGEVLHLINNPDVLAKVESDRSRLAIALAAGTPADEVVERIYLATLCRLPTSSERELARDHLRKTGDRAAGLRDLQHALFNSDEFLLRH